MSTTFLISVHEYVLLLISRYTHWDCQYLRLTVQYISECKQSFNHMGAYGWVLHVLAHLLQITHTFLTIIIRFLIAFWFCLSSATMGSLSYQYSSNSWTLCLFFLSVKVTMFLHVNAIEKHGCIWKVSPAKPQSNHVTLSKIIEGLILAELFEFCLTVAT